MYEAEEIFVTSTVGDVMPVTELDGAPTGVGMLAPVTLTLRNAYRVLHEDAQFARPLDD
jgi:branched-subunit amino acid aminotransferase/4-amino-4-deoxychorismate lyase